MNKKIIIYYYSANHFAWENFDAPEENDVLLAVHDESTLIVEIYAGITLE